MEKVISFFSEETSFLLDNEDSIYDWILNFIKDKGYKIYEINYIFCSDDYLLGLNREYLDHDYYTDILTFPYEVPLEKTLFSDIYISVDRVKANADEFHSSFEDELHRVMIHGILHLMGFDDHNDEDRKKMRDEESKALLLRRMV
ncbi:MAG: rRNA maturation RNase YbeY [Bacteroidetes bacterium]|nr:rRNA maturation RNase YbeY [Bacteroidota bacterium]MCB0842262.1 rRNA maturation RNase YbeY [Bacteroidota bacterium]MCB0854017.1 rRNA maturation RNase YbeY [Bacteroidota bacterium]